MNNLAGKTVFITGGTTGIGLETAKLALEEGANVVIYSIAVPGSPDITALKRSARILIIKGDIRNSKKVKSAVASVIKKFGSIDILINNAAIAQRKEFIKTNKKDWDLTIDINIKGTLTITQEILKRMLQKKSGMIINISSGAGMDGIGNLSLYSLSKAAVLNFSQSLHEEVSKKGIDVFTIAPGSTDTKMFHSVFPDHKPHHTPKAVAQIIIKSAKKEIHPDDKLIIDVFYHTT